MIHQALPNLVHVGPLDKWAVLSTLRVTNLDKPITNLDKSVTNLDKSIYQIYIINIYNKSKICQDLL